LPPALCDVTATSVMYVALTLTTASSFQMLRGSIMIFVGILSVVFLKKKLEWFRWLGMFIILAGLIVVGVSDFLQVKSFIFYVKKLLS
jgi:drug/metabolite transporter (DMT)-like permease